MAPDSVTVSGLCESDDVHAQDGQAPSGAKTIPILPQAEHSALQFNPPGPDLETRALIEKSFCARRRPWVDSSRNNVRQQARQALLDLGFNIDVLFFIVVEL